MSIVKRRREMNERVVALIIHAFTICHVVTAACLGPGAGPALTPMTSIMVFAIGTQCDAEFNVKKALKVISTFVGLILGTSIAETLIGLFPIIGNLANAAATGFVTELLGWSTYVILRDRLEEKGRISGFDKIMILRAAKKTSESNAKFLEKLKAVRERMDEEERAEYDRLMKIVAGKSSTDEERVNAIYSADAILKKYNVCLGV